MRRCAASSVVYLAVLAMAGCLSAPPADSNDDGNSTGSTTAATSTTTFTSSAASTSSTTADATSNSTSTSAPTSGGDTSGGTTGNEGPVAYRVASIALRDPHLFLGLQMAVDVTQSGVNNYFANALESDSQPADGVLDIGFVLTFDPLDQTDDNGGQFVLVNAACTAPAPSMSCTLAPGTFAFNSTYLSSITECYAPDPDELSTYDDPPSSPSPTMGPCFVTQPFDVTLITPAFTMPLSSATVAARYAGDPADELLQGNVRGFISESVASTVMLNSAVFNNTSLADVLRAEDMDQNATGWMFHVSFTAVPVDYDGG